MRFASILIVAALFVSQALVTPVMACPSCQMAIESTNGDSQESLSNLSRAYNQSIYLFMTMPFLLLGTFGFLIYRGVRQNEAYRQAQLIEAVDSQDSKEESAE